MGLAFTTHKAVGFTEGRPGKCLVSGANGANGVLSRDTAVPRLFPKLCSSGPLTPLLAPGRKEAEQD